MREIIRVGFAGKQGSGKTTCAEMLENILRNDGEGQVASINLKFADPIYECLRVLHRWDDVGYEKPREFMQKFADICRLEFGDDVFELLFEEKYFTAEMSCDVIKAKRIIISVDDVRHENEAILLKHLGFYVIGIECPDEIRSKRIRILNSQHRSETELDDLDEFCDMKITNDVTEDELRDILSMTAKFVGWSGDGFTKIGHTERTFVPEEDMRENCRCDESCHT